MILPFLEGPMSACGQERSNDQTDDQKVGLALSADGWPPCRPGPKLRSPWCRRKGSRPRWPLHRWAMGVAAGGIPHQPRVEGVGGEDGDEHDGAEGQRADSRFDGDGATE